MKNLCLVMLATNTIFIDLLPAHYLTKASSESSASSLRDFLRKSGKSVDTHELFIDYAN